MSAKLKVTSHPRVQAVLWCLFGRFDCPTLISVTLHICTEHTGWFLFLYSHCCHVLVLYISMRTPHNNHAEICRQLNYKTCSKFVFCLRRFFFFFVSADVYNFEQTEETI